ncbi:MAG: permease [Candidatus Helarchaeota archaeon]
MEIWKKISTSFIIFLIIVLTVGIFAPWGLFAGSDQLFNIPWYPFCIFIPYPTVTEKGMFYFAAEYWSHAWICILIGFIIAGFFSEFISKERMASWLKSGSWYGYLLAALAGGILGVCSCAILPLFASLKRKGAGLGPAITFLIAGPAINPIGFLLTINQLGLGFGISRIIGSIVIAIATGVIMDCIFKETAIKKTLLMGDVSKPSFGTVQKIRRRVRTRKISFKVRVRKAFQYSWDYTVELLWIIIIGVFIAGLVNGLIPTEWITSSMGGEAWYGYPIASFIGIPTFIVPPNEIAMGVALFGKGANPGVVLTLLLAGPTVSIATIYVVREVISDKKTIIYVLSVFGLSIMLGIILSPLVIYLIGALGIEIASWISWLYHDVVIYGLLIVTILGAWYAHKKSHKKKKIQKK